MRSLSLSDEVRLQFLACRLALGIERPPEIAADRVERIEAELGFAVPDDLVAAWAAIGNDPSDLIHSPQLSPECTAQALDVMGEPRDDWPRPFFPLGFPDDQGDKDVVLECVCPQRGAGGGTEIISVHFFCWTPKRVHSVAWGVDLGSEPVPLMRWLGALCQVTELHEAEARRRIAEFQCRIVGAEPERVRHPSFGQGVVLAAHDDRLTVRFEDGQIRKVLRSAVTAT